MVRTKGGYDDGLLFLDRYAESLRLYVCNSINPLRIEGQKSIVFELAHQLCWKLPDWIVVPGGALSNASALGKGLAELRAIGLIDAVPRIAVVQAEGDSPFHRMVQSGLRSLSPTSKPDTIATALHIGNPPNWQKALRYAIDLTDGVTASVSDEEIMEAKTLIDRSGIGCEPASAATLAGLRKLVASGTVGKDETAACLLTGSLLKDTDAIEHSLRIASPNRAAEPCPVELSIENIRRVLM